MRRAGGLAIVAMAMIVVARGACAQEAPAPVATEADDPPASRNLWFLRAGYSPARVLAASPFVSGEDVARTLTLELGRQTDGTRDWHRVYNYPSYGIGFYAGRFDQEQEIGRPFATYGFFSWPFPVSNRVQLTADFGLGVSWNWTEFDRQTNPANTALGSDVAYHIDGGFSLRFLATNRTSVYAGVNVTHWSNGAAKQPNLGLAVVGPKVSVRQNFAPQILPPRAGAADLPRFEPSWEFVVGGAGSGKNAVATTSSRIEAVDRWRDFGAFDVTAALQRQFYRFGKVATGADITYDGATGARVEIVDGRQVESRAAVDDRFALGLYGGYEHVIARFSLLFQLGYTVWRGFEDAEIPRFYQRYGSRFYFTDHFWATFAVRSIKVRKANFLEFGLGYRVRWSGDLTTHFLPAEIDARNPPGVGDVLQRIPVEDDEVGALARGDGAEAVEPEDAGRRARCGHDRLSGRQAGGHHVLQLDVLGPSEHPAGARAADVGPERDADAGGIELRHVPRQPVPFFAPGCDRIRGLESPPPHRSARSASGDTRLAKRRLVEPCGSVT